MLADMKKLLILLSFLSYGFTNAQTFIPMLDELNEWSVTFRAPGSQFSTLYTIQGEQIMNGVTYKYIQGGVITGCLLREENGIVYFYDICNDTEDIMLDFNLEVGDTFYVGPNTCSSCSFSYHSDLFDEIVVVNSTIEFIAGQNRKVLEFTEVDMGGGSFYSEFWIEGIGSTAGISPASINFDFDHLLICFTRDGERTFFNDYTECIFELGVEAFNISDIKLTPNPVTESSILKLPTAATINRIIIYNINGRVIKEEAITNDYFTINVVDYTSGFYFYKVFSDTGLVKTDRFIVK